MPFGIVASIDGSLRAPLSLAAGAATAAEAASRAAAVVLNTAEAFRRTDLLRTLVQKPDVCKPTTCDQEIETWSDWKHGLKNYLSVVDAKYVEEMDVIENNGYEVWRALTMEMQPSSRQRQLALVAQLSTVRFDPAKSLSEQVTRYEEIIAEYERISSLQFSEDLKITTLVQAAPAALQINNALASELYLDFADDLYYLPGRDAKGKKGKEGKDKKGKGDPKGKGKGKGGKNDAAAKPKAKPKGECWYCGKTGHFARDCRAKAKEGKGKGGGKEFSR
ncbi:hypothetical protein AK812_SmicGene23009 [Symbiodinium microadriaticum]|uniref:CCHC-type domain-containing protein n=1 Tax=Symbiodinium microadriaticum TaxID=2951 RepID=A0A1Q9DIE5_SYMMI|nr:hypothetical protein AK812_SmicGene23009 [Symbiodinium microadriaticum]